MRAFNAFLLIERGILVRFRFRIAILLVFAVISSLVTLYFSQSIDIYAMHFIFAAFLGCVYANSSNSFEFEEGMDSCIFCANNRRVLYVIAKLLVPILFAIASVCISTLTLLPLWDTIPGAVFILNRIMRSIFTVSTCVPIYLLLNILKMGRISNYLFNMITTASVIYLYFFLMDTTLLILISAIFLFLECCLILSFAVLSKHTYPPINFLGEKYENL